jgi:hypothetical protein
MMRMNAKKSLLFGFLFLFAVSCSTEQDKQAQMEEQLRSEKMEELKRKEEEVKRNQREEEKQKTFSEKVVYTFMTDYYNDLSMNTFNAYDYYANEVDQFISKKNTNPAAINKINQSNDEFQEKSVSLYEETIRKTKMHNGIQFFQFRIYFSCYRKSKEQYQTCHVDIEVGLDQNKKMTSYRELKVSDLEFLDYDPNGGC